MVETGFYSSTIQPETQCLALTSLTLKAVLMPQSTKTWNYEHEPSCSTKIWKLQFFSGFSGQENCLELLHCCLFTVHSFTKLFVLITQT